MGNYKNLMEFINTIKTIKQFLLCSKKVSEMAPFFMSVLIVIQLGVG